mgnify:CR=1 FL=1
MPSKRSANPGRKSHSLRLIPLVSAATLIATTSLTSCKTTGRHGNAAGLRAASLPADQLDFPTVKQLSAARTRALAAVSNAGGKEPQLGTINMYPSGEPACPKFVTVEIGISYDSGTKEDSSRAAGFYLKPDPENRCASKDELVMNAGRAIDAFLGTRPIDDVGTLESMVKLDPKEFLKVASRSVRLQDSKAWNVFIKTLLNPATMDSVQYVVEMQCLDDSIGDAYFKAADGSRIQRGEEPEEGPVCPVVARAPGDR